MLAEGSGKEGCSMPTSVRMSLTHDEASSVALDFVKPVLKMSGRICKGEP